MQADKIELIVVFKKGVEVEDAERILRQAGAAFRSGMDSSRGKIYFYKTGPKYIVTFKTEEEKKRLAKELEKSKHVYEVYTPDWTKHKD